MSVYFITIFIMLALCWLYTKVFIKETDKTEISQQTLLKSEKNKKFIVFLIFALFAFVAGFRYKVGTDFHSYYRTDIWANKFKEGDFGDPGFTLLAIIASFLFNGANGAVTILSAIITVALFIFTIAKRSENLTVSLLLFIFVGCFTGLFNGVRQYLATAILFAGFYYIQEKKLFKWTLVVLVASTMHVTAILMFFIYFACNLKCNLLTVIIYFAFAIVLLYLYEPLFDLIGVLKQEEIDAELGYMSRQVNILRILVQCVPLILFLIVSKNSINDDVECSTLFNVCLLNAAIAIASMNSTYFARFFIYTMGFQALMYPKMLNKASQTNKLVFTTLLLIFYFAFWFYEVSKSSSLVNFQWIFNYF